MPRERRSHTGRVEAGGNLLQGELLQEKAANLGRLARGLERALRALAEHDAGAPGGPLAPAARRLAPHERTRTASPERAEREDQRKRLLADAGDALFLYVVQREVLGLGCGTAQALDDLGVPREVRLCMAPRSVLLGR
jgi:hypothetical protein